MVVITTANVVGTAAQSRWSQAQTLNYGETKRLLIVLRLTCVTPDSLVDLATIGTELIAEIERGGHGVESGAEVGMLLSSVFADVTADVSVDYLIGYIENNALTLQGRGLAQAYLSRNSQLAKLKDNWNEGEILQGTLLEDDTLVIGTDEFVRAIGVSNLKRILAEDENPAETFAPLLHKQSDSSGMAAVVAEVSLEALQDPPVGDSWWAKLRNREPISIQLRSETPRKLNMWVGGVILLLLSVMIGIGMVRKGVQTREKAYESLNMSVSTKVAETLSASELNPERARALLSEARGEIESYLSGDIRDSYRERATKLMSEVDSTEEKAFKKNEITLSTVVELPILADGLKATKMKSDGKGSLLFTDSSSSRLVAMNLTDRSRQVLDLPSGTTLVDLAVNDTKLYGLSSTTVFELFWKKTEAKKMIEADEFWKEPEQIQLFAGNAYILDKDQGEIWKYPTLGDSFGGRRRWFAVGIAPDLANVVDMKVAGDIWLLTSTGKLERYSRGAPVNFSMEGFPSKDNGKRFSEPSAVWVTDSLIYVLENGAGRVVVFEDDGKYSAQYTSSEFGKASDLVVVDGKGYVLIDNAVKEFGLL